MIKVILTAILSIGLWVTPKTNFEKKTLEETKKQQENKYTLTEGEAINLSNAMAISKQILQNSQAPAITVNQICSNFDSIQKVLAIQYNNFHDTTTKKK